MLDVNICVVGAGRWGKNHINTLSKLGAKIGIVDKKVDKNIKNLFPDLACFNSIDDTFPQNFDGYIISTPPSTHFEIAKKILLKGKPVLVEKPLVLSVKDGEKLLSIVEKTRGKLIVGHLLLFHPAIIKMKELIDSGIIGKVQYLYSNRLNLGVVRKEENVFWSFAPHDISLFQYFSNSFPKEINSSGGAFLQKEIFDTTITYLKYPNGIQGHIYVSWLHPFKEHRLVIIGTKGTLHFEDSSNTKPLLFYEKKREKGERLLIKNKSPRLIEYDSKLPLVNELNYFIEIINGDPIQKANIHEGLDVIRILEMATKSLNR
tara:strand:- start:15645 stop:16598 length:954 start_codon:yes stop_codon:yes gene_type:complete